MVKDIVLAITYQCNSRCQFCHIWQRKETYSCQPADYQKLPHNLENVNISGGEPFLRNDLPEIIRIITRQCPQAKIVISTNGFRPSLIKKTMQEIMQFRRDIGVAVSLDGFGLSHERIRGVSGGFSLALETIRLLKELGVKDLKIGFTLDNDNIEQLRKVYRLSRELGVEFSLAVCHNSEHYFQKQDNQIQNFKAAEKEIVWLMHQELKSFSPKRWLRAYFAWGAIEFLKTGRRILPDYSGLKSLFIDSFGIVYPSDVWGLAMGQLDKIDDWDSFSNRVKEIVNNNRAPASWMVCTVRQAMKKHWPRVLWWIAAQKIYFLAKIRKGSYQRYQIVNSPRGSFDKERAVIANKICRWGLWRKMKSISRLLH